MNKFTFGVLAYNVEEYIIECLESIKYQIECFGNEYEVTLIVAEDCSTDHTLELIEYWTELNTELFLGGVEIYSNANNQGLVKNITELYKKIKTRSFKVIDGDDIFYKNNVFGVLADKDVMITETVHFRGSNILKRDINGNFYEILLCKKPLSFLKDAYQYMHVLDTPGIFFSKKFLNQNLYEAMSSYKMLDDVPRWRYIFNQPNISVGVADKPYILYRLGSGVSTNSNHEKRDVFDEDQIKLFGDLKKESYTHLRLRVLKRSFFKKMINYYYKYSSMVFKGYRKSFEDVLEGNEGEKYLSLIISRSELILANFYNNHKENRINESLHG